jgi:serine/threonine protein kinase
MNANQNRNVLKPGYQLHWYSIERVLGHGGFGITYLARDTNLNQQVAIKEFFPADIATRNDDMTVQPKTNADADQYQWGLDRFRSEAQTLARFDHPNIIRIFTVFEANHTAYLIMRYEKGEALNDILERRKRLSETELLEIVLPILDGLGKVHETGFVHRDIQPANIYIREDKSPVLIDFGAAREAQGKPRTVTILVAPGYAPYEQYIANNQEQGPWTDIYGLGATLYRAVAGVAPIDAIERSRGILGSTRDVLVPATVVGQGRYSEAFLKAVDHALMFNEKDRPQTAKEWAQELMTGKPQENDIKIDKKSSASMAAFSSSTPPGKPADISKEIKPADREFKTSTLIRWAAPVLLFLVGIAVGLVFIREGNVVDKPAASEKEVQQIVSPKDEATVKQSEQLRQKIESDSDKLAAMEKELSNLETKRLAEQRRLQEVIEERLQAQETIKKENARADKPVTAATPVKQINVREAIEPIQADAAPAPEIPDPLDQALAAFRGKDYKKALDLIKPMADMGRPEAQYYLAGMYRNGQGILANNSSALNWMRKAAWQGHGDAQIALAKMYFEGVNGAKDYFLAYSWYLLAERNGVNSHVSERVAAERELQLEQLPQAIKLVNYLYQRQGLKGSDFAGSD